MNTGVLPNKCAICPTRRLCIARELSADCLYDLADRITTTDPMQRGDLLFHAGDPAGSWYVVRSGVFKSSIVTAEGAEYVGGFHYPGEIMGISGSATGRHQETAIALSSATICEVELDKLPRLWELGADRSLLRLVAEHDRTQVLLRINLSQSSAEARIAGFIKLLMERTGRQGFDPTCLAIPMSRTDLANHLGLTLECLSRVLSKWRKAQILSADRKSMTILQPDTISTLAYHLAA